MDTTKISVSICTSLLRSFDKDVRGSYLKRDAFLNHILKMEAPHLASDLNGKRLSSQGRRHIAGALKRMGTTQVNIVVDKSTAEALNAVVVETGIVRDAFVNRLLMLLRSSAVMINSLELPHFITGSEFESCIEPMPTSPMQAIAAILGDPFYYLRIAVEERFSTGLYLLDLPPQLTGFSCYLPDSHVPGTADYKQSMKELDDFLTLELDSLETRAFGGGQGDQK
jgi:hypothetical protein